MLRLNELIIIDTHLLLWVIMPLILYFFLCHETERLAVDVIPYYLSKEYILLMVVNVFCIQCIYFSMRVVYYYIAFYELVLVSCTNLLLITLYFLYNKICSIQNQKKKIFPLLRYHNQKALYSRLEK